MRINLTTGEFVEVTITSGTLQNISPQASVEVASTATKNTGIILPPYATLSYSDNATVYARNAWDDDSTCVIAVEPFKKAGEGGEYTLPIATSSKLGGVKVGSNLSIDESGVLSGTAVSGEQNYSTTEQQIGTWIDGKPVYQATIVLPDDFDCAANTAYTSDYDISALNIKRAIRVEATFLHSNIYQTVPIIFINENSAQIVAVYGAVVLLNDSPFFRFSYYRKTGTSHVSDIIATLQYTKTTD